MPWTGSCPACLLPSRRIEEDGARAFRVFQPESRVLLASAESCHRCGKPEAIVSFTITALLKYIVVASR